ncbi:hypothetical protein CRI77_05350 [Mycolicibacterium duvalii]|uniref:Uncharacterized protein n=1 Tax=Mycolicibacterium duvalii TaxID=39688 RepID=A0A7I7K1A4_9MYCO|nr:hypothetical protein [Mycolicibacterium duvalii]MCV7370249.1 hypothetical protein [Mycolicibacterium duvalii]PEG43588.1 hypothetical protein CRI77_05350 [Mycolicibacterium duvalii]BBX17384.1 hypothetical protein MDUV_22440 [Mycolicibacterium duvalii]
MSWRAAGAALVVVLTAGCSAAISGTPTWPGARLERVLLTETDFPPGVRYERVVKEAGQPDSAGMPPAMLSRPRGCSDALTRDIAATAERGPGSAAEYVVAYDGARMLVTVLSWPLNLERLAATALRCAEFRTFFDPSDPGIPMTTTKIDGPRPGALVYQQTMVLPGSSSSIFFSFENIGATAVFGIAFPTPDPSIPVKGTLPQTFLDVIDKQAQRAQTG